MNPQVEHIAMLARAGYLARAIVYFALGYLTLATGEAEGTASVLDPLADVPGGNALMMLLAIGLAAYGLFRLYGAWVDLENDGDDWKGRGKRFGHVLSGCAHLVLGWGALKLGFGGTGPNDGAAGEAAAEQVINLPGGWLLIVIVAAGIALAAVSQASRAWSGKFMALMSRETPRWAEIVGRIGYAARAAVFAALAWAILEAGLSGNPGEIGFQDALAAYRDEDELYRTIAAGLAMFGVFSLVMARYRDVCDSPMVKRLMARAGS